MKGTFTPNISEKGELLASRISMAGAIALAGYLGLHPPGFAAALMMGIFSKRINNQAAIWGMISGLGITMLYVFQHKGIMFIPGTSFLGGMEPNWFLGISPNAFGAVGAIVNFGVAFLVSRVTAEPPEHIQHLVEDIRVPQGAAAASDH